MSEVKNEGLEVVDVRAIVTDAFISMMESALGMKAPDCAPPAFIQSAIDRAIDRINSEAIVGYAVRDARISELEKELSACATAVDNCELFRVLIAELESAIEVGKRLNSRQAETIKEYQDLTAGGDVSIGMLRAECNQLRAELAASSAKYLALIALAPSAPLTVSAPFAKQVVLPERRAISVINGYRTMGHNEGWNACPDEVARLNSSPAAPAADAGKLADAFLSWKLPDSVRPDGCAMDPTYPHRYGTNLMTWAQAKEMFEYVLAAHRSTGVA